jgi:hypothetical protein
MNSEFLKKMMKNQNHQNRGKEKKEILNKKDFPETVEIVKPI